MELRVFSNRGRASRAPVDINLVRLRGVVQALSAVRRWARWRVSRAQRVPERMREAELVALGEIDLLLRRIVEEVWGAESTLDRYRLIRGLCELAIGVWGCFGTGEEECRGAPDVYRDGASVLARALHAVEQRAHR